MYSSCINGRARRPFFYLSCSIHLLVTFANNFRPIDFYGSFILFVMSVRILGMQRVCRAIMWEYCAVSINAKGNFYTGWILICFSHGVIYTILPWWNIKNAERTRFLSLSPGSLIITRRTRIFFLFCLWNECFNLEWFLLINIIAVLKTIQFGGCILGLRTNYVTCELQRATRVIDSSN